MELRLLGPVEILAHSGLVHVGEPRRSAVLAALLVDAGRVVSTPTLIDRVWGDRPPGQAVKTLGTYITRIRRVLEESFDDATVTVVNQPGGYRLTARPDQVDLLRFRGLVAAARVPGLPAERRADLLRQAVALHRGDPLTGVDGTWAARTREQLTGELLSARAEWAEAEVAVGNATAVLAPLTTLAGAHPLVEPLVVALVRALVAAGRPTEALERCRLHRRHLADEYGTDPSPQLTALYTEVLRAQENPVKRVETPAAQEIGTVPAKPRRRRRGPVLAACAATAVLAVALGAVVHFRAAAAPAAVHHFTATEDFAGAQLAPTEWHANETAQPNGSSWSPSMVRVDGGELQVSGTGRNPTGRGNIAGSVCWCLERGVIRTYGVWEVRAKIDIGTGYSSIIGLYSDVGEDTAGWGFLTLARFDDGERRTMYPVIRGVGGRPVDGPPVSGDFTAWNTFSIEWRAGFVAVSLNGAVIYDTRKSAVPVTVPSVPMFLYMQVVSGPDGPVPAPNPQTPSQVTMHVDWARYTS